MNDLTNLFQQVAIRTGRRDYDGYFTVTDKFGTCMVVDSPWKDSYLDAFRSLGAKSLRLTCRAFRDLSDISFLSELTDLDLVGLDVYGAHITDLRVVERFHSLKRIGIDCPSLRTPLDFSNFPLLEQCFVIWRPAMENLFSSAALWWLNVMRYPTKDLSLLRNCRKLRKLQISSRHLQTLCGIQELVELEELDLFQCPKLTSLDGMERLPRVRRIALENCRSLEQINAAQSLPSLNELRLLNCGRIASLGPLKGHPNLEVLGFAGRTEIADGDISIALSIPRLRNVWFDNRRHYSHTTQKLWKLLGITVPPEKVTTVVVDPKYWAKQESDGD